jgi:hypothetical protein
MADVTRPRSHEHVTVAEGSEVHDTISERLIECCRLQHLTFHLEE